MQRHQLEHALRAAADAAKAPQLVLVGSQAVHAHTDEPPAEVLVSEECDVFVKDRWERLDALVLLPAGWESRLKPIRLGLVTAWCLEVNDLTVSKLNAGRLKDYEFVNAMLRTRLAQFDEVVRRIEIFADPHQKAVLLARLRIASEATP